jgi:hypothetical protein
VRGEAVSGTLVELCAGTASVSLWALVRAAPLTGFMGSKRRYAPQLVQALDCDRPDRVVLVDAGPWGDVWSVLQDEFHRARAVQLLTVWDEYDLPPLFDRLVSRAPSSDPAERVAQYLCLQARSASGTPIWWSAEAERWENPTGSKTEAAHQRGGCDASTRQRGGCRGMQRPATLARRVRALDRLPWDRVSVVHGLVGTVAPIPGAVVLLDPPYQGSPRYAALLSRADVLAVACRWAAASCRVAVSEAEPLPLDGWTARRLADREWVTASWPIVLPEQLGLFAEVA